ncbi:MAG: hypothetical protein AB7N76_11675 [Planctomycetota bacterium]
MRAERALAARLRAWRSFRDIAHASSSLAASQAVRWTAHEHAARRHLGLVLPLASRLLPPPAPRDPRPLVLVGFGTDLGLCGRLNHEVAACLSAALAHTQPALLLLVGRRLRDSLGAEHPALEEPAPASIDAAQDLAERAMAEVRRLCGTLARVGLARIDERGHARLWWEEDLAPMLVAPAAPAPLLAPPDRAAVVARDLLLQARLHHSACAAALAESRLRQELMRRARETADRRIQEQERQLRRARQERITQEMLEVRAATR